MTWNPQYFLLTRNWQGWEFGAQNWGRQLAGPVPHCLQRLPLQKLQALLQEVGSRNRRDPASSLPAAQGLQEGQLVQGAQVPQAAPAGQRRLYSTVMVGGAAKR